MIHVSNIIKLINGGFKPTHMNGISSLCGTLWVIYNDVVWSHGWIMIWFKKWFMYGWIWYDLLQWLCLKISQPKSREWSSSWNWHFRCMSGTSKKLQHWKPLAPEAVHRPVKPTEHHGASHEAVTPAKVFSKAKIEVEEVEVPQPKSGPNWSDSPQDFLVSRHFKGSSKPL